MKSKLHTKPYKVCFLLLPKFHNSPVKSPILQVRKHRKEGHAPPDMETILYINGYTISAESRKLGWKKISNDIIQ
jgi:hypothetical protein